MSKTETQPKASNNAETTTQQAAEPKPNEKDWRKVVDDSATLAQPATGEPVSAAELSAAQADSSNTDVAEGTGPSAAQQVLALQAEIEQLKNALVRAEADVQNIEARAQRTIAQKTKFAVDGLLEALLPVADSLQQGLDGLNPERAEHKAAYEGLNLTQALLNKVLADFGVTCVMPLGEQFDPALHEALTMQPSADQPPNSIIQVVQAGYTLHGRVIRAARVVLAQAVT